ncbi:MAG: DUF86 domain-containing protein [Anaeromyxobacteraceae bacterium]|nr:DUF86 domain-containing protein [Anaeromyxobacteraceae bacterium]
MSRHDDSVRLRHMLDAAVKAVALTAERSKAQVAADEIGQLALARLLEIVGEAAGKVSPEYRAAHPELPWAEMSGLRNRLAHAYFDIDLDVLLDIVAKDLPPLIRQVEGLLGAKPA